MAAEMTLQLADPNLTKEQMSELFDREIERFSHYMATLGDWKAVGPLNPAERALIKTYLIQKITGRLDPKEG